MMADPLMPHFLELPDAARDLMASYEQQYRGTATGIPTGHLWNALRELLQAAPRLVTPQPEPDRPGWYYGRIKIAPPESRAFKIMPYKVMHPEPDSPHLYAVAGSSVCALGLIEWFGPRADDRCGVVMNSGKTALHPRQTEEISYELSEYVAPKKMPYRVTAQEVLDAGWDHVQVYDYRPDWRACCALALVRATWHWRDACQVLANAARRRLWEEHHLNLDDMPDAVYDLHDALRDPRERAHFDRIQRGEY